MSLPSYMYPIYPKSKWLPAEYPDICNTYRDYSNPPLPVPSGWSGFSYGYYKTCYEQFHATKKQIDARDAAAQQAMINAQKIANQQKALNDNYNSLLSQYQQLLQAYIAEKNAHVQETAELLRLKAEMARISNILKSVGLL